VIRLDRGSSALTARSRSNPDDVSGTFSILTMLCLLSADRAAAIEGEAARLFHRDNAVLRVLRRPLNSIGPGLAGCVDAVRPFSSCLFDAPVRGKKHIV